MKILNSPNRRITRADTERLLERGLDQGQSIEEVLERAFKDPMITYSSQATIRLRELLDPSCGLKIHNLHLPASQLIGQVVDEVDYFNYFDDYYGEGEQAFERKQAVKSFIDFAEENDQPAAAL